MIIIHGEVIQINTYKNISVFLLEIFTIWKISLYNHASSFFNVWCPVWTWSIISLYTFLTFIAVSKHWHFTNPALTLFSYLFPQNSYVTYSLFILPFFFYSVCHPSVRKLSIPSFLVLFPWTASWVFLDYECKLFLFSHFLTCFICGILSMRRFLAFLTSVGWTAYGSLQVLSSCVNRFLTFTVIQETRCCIVHPTCGF